MQITNFQDIPKALSTWSARISLKSEDEDFDVFCTGETEAEVQQSGELRHYLSHHNSFPLPMSTFAIAVGRWSVRTIDCGQPRTRFIGPRSLVEKNFAAVTRYLACCLSAAEDLLGRYPLPRLDVVVVHRSFSGLGLASPHLLFLSPSLFAGDESLFIKISHEVSHAWFGIMIGSLDWTEAWISEGFATFLEEDLHAETLRLQGDSLPEEVSVLRAVIKHESLREEVGNTEQEMQLLQPMEGKRDVCPHLLHLSIHRKGSQDRWARICKKWLKSSCWDDTSSLSQGVFSSSFLDGKHRMQTEILLIAQGN